MRVAGQLPEAALIPAARLGLLAGLNDQGEGGFFSSPLTLALQELVSLSLMEKLRESQVRLHTLVREFAARQTPREEVVAFRCRCVDHLITAYEEAVTLEDNCARRGVDALQEDLIATLEMLIQTPESPQARDLEIRLQSLLRLVQREAHTLRGWDPQQQPALFAQQVHNRAVDMGLTVLITSTAARLAQLHSPYLVLLWRARREPPALERTLSGHNDMVFAVAVTPDGRRVISGSRDCTLKVWDLQTGQEERTLRGHYGSVRAVAVTLDGQSIISASDDGTLKAWNFRTGQVERPLGPRSFRMRVLNQAYEWMRVRGHPYEWLSIFRTSGDPERSLAVTPDGCIAVSASWEDPALKIWDLKAGQMVRTLSGHTDSVYRVSVSCDGHHLVSASGDGTLRVWDLQTGRSLRTLIGHTGTVLTVTATSDGRRAISASNDGTLKVWDLQTGQETLALPDI